MKPKILAVFFVFTFFIFSPFLSSFCPDMHFVKFEDGFLPLSCPPHTFGETFKSYYDNYRKGHYLEKEYLIPKIIHFIWLGSPLPEKTKQFIATWRDKHPDWEIRIWNDENAASFRLQNQAAFDKANNYGEKSDILRYELLYHFGGVYVDSDFECLKPFDFLHQTCEFYTGIVQYNHALLNGLIGVKQGHPIIKACIDYLQIGNGDHDAQRIMQQTGPYHFTQMFLSHAALCDRTKLAILPPTFFYPFPATIALEKNISEEEAKAKFIKPESFAIHYWSGSWKKKSS
ncbi:MAG: hypothetical protein JST18_08040 [Bacteroidetes bacterium]|nr:hypothetical protein [Bacteroidota bacterium]